MHGVDHTTVLRDLRGANAPRQQSIAEALGAYCLPVSTPNKAVTLPDVPGEWAVGIVFNSQGSGNRPRIPICSLGGVPFSVVRYILGYVGGMGALCVEGIEDWVLADTATVLGL